MTSNPHRPWIFDEDGLPWSSRLRWGWLLFWISGILLVLAPVVGIYLGLWLRSKGRSAWVLGIYVALIIVFVAAFFADRQRAADVVGAILLALWLIGAFVLRREVAAYYSSREPLPLRLNPLLTALFGPWYIGGNLRADFPLDSAGQVGSGVLKLVD